MGKEQQLCTSCLRTGLSQRSVVLDTLRGVSNLSEEVDVISVVKRDGYWLLRSVLRFIFEKEVSKKLEKVQKKVIKLIRGLINL